MSIKTNSPLAGRLALFNLSAAYTVTPEDSGKVFLLDAAGALISLPAAALGNRGCHYKFIVDIKVTSDWTITSASGDVHLQIGSGGVAEGDTITAGSADTAITFVKNLADEGDFVRIFSTGTKWLVEGQAHATANITAA